MTRERQIIDKIQNVLEKVGDDLSGYRVLLFGSRAGGSAGARSDFDVGVLGPESLSLRTFYEIEDMLDQIDTLYRIDWVDLNRTSDSFRREALKNAEVLYE